MNRRITRPGKELTLAEHHVVALHLKAAHAHLMEVARHLNGRAYTKHVDRLRSVCDASFLTTLRSGLDDELAALPEVTALDNREFQSIYYGTAPTLRVAQPKRGRA